MPVVRGPEIQATHELNANRLTRQRHGGRRCFFAAKSRKQPGFGGGLGCFKLAEVVRVTEWKLPDPETRILPRGNPMSLIRPLHDKLVFNRRITVLHQHLSGMLAGCHSILDVGCGDGQLSGMIAQSLPDATIEGIDVLVRPETHIPVRQFDGVQIPADDNSVDCVMMVDVLHHTDDPEIMLREAQRVARRWIVLKDHTRNGFLAGPTLRFMDWVGNSHHGVRLPYNYLSLKEWQNLFAKNGMKIDQWNANLGLYGMPGDLLFGRSLHFVCRLDVGANSQRKAS